MLTSYAQNFEDIILWRALKNVERGFYIDIGAQDPVIDSVSKLFYDKGWRGIDAEPQAKYAESLRRARPEDTVIEAIISDQNGESTLFEISDTGLSTPSREVAARQAAAGWTVRSSKVKSLKLCDLLEANKCHEVHWLKIDVEGSEAEVIRGWGASEVRPWIVLVESIDPVTREDVSDSWEENLCQLGYEFAYFDGLNRFYVSKAHRDLKSVISVGPNVFDEFALSGTSSAPFSLYLRQQIEEIAARLSALSAEAATVQAEMQQLRIEHAAKEAEQTTRLADANHEVARLHQVIHEQNEWARASMAHIEGLTKQLSAMQQAWSWRLTQPLRAISWHTRLIVKRIRQAPAALVRRGQNLVYRKAPGLYSRITINRLARRVYSAFVRSEQAQAVPPAHTSAPAKPVFGTGLVERAPGAPALAGLPASTAANPTLASLIGEMRGWTLGGRRDARD